MKNPEMNYFNNQNNQEKNRDIDDKYWDGSGSYTKDGKNFIYTSHNKFEAVEILDKELFRKIRIAMKISDRSGRSYINRDIDTGLLNDSKYMKTDILSSEKNCHWAAFQPVLDYVNFEGDPALWAAEDFPLFENKEYFYYSDFSSFKKHILSNINRAGYIQIADSIEFNNVKKPSMARHSALVFIGENSNIIVFEKVGYHHPFKMKSLEDVYEQYSESRDYMILAMEYNDFKKEGKKLWENEIEI